jgi:hypothetical protein
MSPPKPFLNDSMTQTAEIRAEEKEGGEKGEGGLGLDRGLYERTGLYETGGGLLPTDESTSGWALSRVFASVRQVYSSFKTLKW